MDNRRSGEDTRSDKLSNFLPPDFFPQDEDRISHSPGDVTPTASNIVDHFTAISPTDNQWNFEWSSASRTESEYSFESDATTVHAISRRDSEDSTISQASATSYRWQGMSESPYCIFFWLKITANHELLQW
jgi:hypothetical protein